MAITKSNKHKLSLDYDKPNKKGECTLATPYALMRSLILDSQISITPLGSCSTLHSKVFPQLNKWARGLSWTSRKSIYTPNLKNIPVGVQLSIFGVIGRACQSDGTRPVSIGLASVGREPLE
jgi:hypothetical protein